MRVSVIVPLYNKGRWIKRALDSIASQTFGDFEVIVVDDGSTDEGPEIVSNYKDARFRLIRQPNSGPGAARNRGIADSSGEFVAFLDADDEWFEDYLEESIRSMEQFGKDTACVSSGYIEYPGGISRQAMWERRGIQEGRFRLSAGTDPMRAVYKLAYMHPCSTLARKDVFGRWGGYYDRGKCLFGEDAYVWLKVLLNEVVSFRLLSGFKYHCEASALAKNYRCPRPIEPFLLDSSEIESVCPAHLRVLLSKMLAIRAFKTACMLGYWGKVQQAQALFQRFYVPGAWSLPYCFPAMVCSTRFGGTLGKTWRRLLGSRSFGS